MQLFIENSGISLLWVSPYLPNIQGVREIVSGIYLSMYYGARHSSTSIFDKFNRNNSNF